METVQILLIEDNEGDILLTTEAFEEAKIANQITVIRNGKEAIDYLFKKGKFENAISPDLILLDVNLPLKSGHEILDEIKKDERTRQIPVIMLTTSSSKKDIDLAYQKSANCYITKPVEVDKFMEAVGSIENYWFQLVKLPTNPT
ncbi:response regulator [Leptospira sp. GIMC2001]|uniref:response regulator n=1 Tax=Leptospira sp. GIMC2001 TaxID=1513297 RepID=UPI00234A30F2|nr:response regulator [Leptospira sp. GIMC2001]WCL48807.1 response regulator [Leptospira sp. GIMC2001]